MRRKYKNQLFTYLASTQFGIDRFELKENETVAGLPADLIEVRGTPFYFAIRNCKTDFDMFDCALVKYAPDFPVEILPKNEYIYFDAVMDNLGYWLHVTLSEYLQDQQEPDFWEDYKKGTRSIELNSIEFGDQTSFSIDEKKQIELSLNELKLLIERNLHTTQEEQKIVNDRLDYLIEASKRLNRFDWKSLAISTLINIIVALSLDTEKGRMIFELFNKVFSSIRMLLDHI